MSSPGEIRLTSGFEAEIQELLVRLVRARSHPGIPRQEEAVALELKAFLEGRGIPSSLTEVRAGRPNLVAAIVGPQAGPHLLVCGHTDTVPPNANVAGDPFSASVEAGRVYGRGSVDMKGALAAMAGALVFLKESGELRSGRVTFAAVIDEEMESLGAEALILSGFKADGGVIGEPTANRIAIGHKGLEWFQVDFEGKAAHGGTPEAGVNAINAAAHFISLIENELIPAFEKRRDPVLGLPVINMGTISGGDQPSTVAARCEVRLDRRWVSTETIEQVFADLESLLRKVRDRRPGLNTRLSRMPGGMATMLHGPLTIDRHHPLVESARRAMGDAGISPDPLTVFPAWTDGALISREAHIPTIIWGPGALDLAHSPRESILLEDVFLAARLYAAAARYFTRSG